MEQQLKSVKAKANKVIDKLYREGLITRRSMREAKMDVYNATTTDCKVGILWIETPPKKPLRTSRR